jgi:hypothetical protein
LTCKKNSIRTFQGKLSRENFPGKTFQGKLSRDNFTGTTFQGDNTDGTHRFFSACDAARGRARYSGAPCSPDEVLDALRKSETCALAFQQSFWAVTPQRLTNSLTHTHTVLLGLHDKSVRGLKRREWARRAACNTGCHCHGPFGHSLSRHLAWLGCLLCRTVAMTRRSRRLFQQNSVSVSSRHRLGQQYTLDVTRSLVSSGGIGPAGPIGVLHTLGSGLS